MVAACFTKKLVKGRNIVPSFTPSFLLRPVCVYSRRARAELDGVTADFEALRARFEGSASKTPPELFFGQLHVFLDSVAEVRRSLGVEGEGEKERGWSCRYNLRAATVVGNDGI